MNYSCADNASVSASIALLAEYEALQAHPLYQMATSLWTFYPPVIVVLGIFGNVMSIVIMSRMTSGDSTVNIFFVAIAVGDTLVLITAPLRKWLELVAGIHVSNIWPPLHYFLFWVHLISSISVSWLLVSVTLQRAMSVVWPHRVSHLCTRRRVRFIIGAIPVIWCGVGSVFVYYVYLLSTVGTADLLCSTVASSVAHIHYANFVISIVGMVMYSLLPFVFLAVGNCTLASTLAFSARKVIKDMGADTSQQAQQRQKVANSVTITVLVVSLTFILLTLPICSYLLLFGFKDTTAMSNQIRAEIYMFSTISNLLSYTNSAINFYLYCLTGRRFRQEFVRIMCCRMAQ